MRDAQEGESGYTTEDMESVIRQAVALRCTRIDIFFMIGLPAQTTASVRATSSIADTSLSWAISACPASSPDGPVHRSWQPRLRGARPVRIRLFARTLEEHRQLLIQPTWEYILNYETKWMTRRELVDATYDAAERLNELKIRHGRLSKRRGSGVARGIAAARALRLRLEAGIAQATKAPPPCAQRGNQSLQHLDRLRQA